VSVEVDGPWPRGVHRVLAEAGVTQVGYVPDAGQRALIEACHADPAMRAVPLTSEEEGVGLAAGAWLGGARAVLLMQSSGVGNLGNALAMAKTCRFPVPMLVTMRGEDGETNPWQIPMGAAAADLLRTMGAHVVRVASADRVAPTVEGALRLAFDAEEAVAVLIAQSVVGVKQFSETPR
jgi:sulfopyruvate decarboxylase alpha subunit